MTQSIFTTENDSIIALHRFVEFHLCDFQTVPEIRN